MALWLCEHQEKREQSGATERVIRAWKDGKVTRVRPVTAVDKQTAKEPAQEFEQFAVGLRKGVEAGEVRTTMQPDTTRCHSLPARDS